MFLSVVDAWFNRNWAQITIIMMIVVVVVIVIIIMIIMMMTE